MITKLRLIKLHTLIKHKIRVSYQHLFNDVVKSQLKNPKSIPIIIISFNQLAYLKQLVDFLLEHQYSNIIIIDNKSTYPPLLGYFRTIEKLVVIHRLRDNFGHLSFWKNKEIFKQYTKGYYVVTDPDIVPISACPENFLEEFRKLLDKAYDRTKVGFSLKIDDIPDNNPNKEQIRNWESQFWNTKIRSNVFKAEIDTTFALYRPNYNYTLINFTKAWRTDYPIQARHGGWYIDINNLNEEQQFYIDTANESASWQINQKGELINKVHKILYKK
nr:glycosyltransferase family 2 protein [uncultured Psychroserpens sp.]